MCYWVNFAVFLSNYKLRSQSYQPLWQALGMGLDMSRSFSLSHSFWQIRYVAFYGLHDRPSIEVKHAHGCAYAGLALFALAGFVTVFQYGMGTTSWVLASEVLPSRERNMGLGICAFNNRIIG